MVYPLYGAQIIYSAFTHLKGYPITGGIVDGPIYNSIFGTLRGIYLANEDQYKEFQSDFVVYHDDFADYSTNEPTMDGTACMAYYFGYLSSQSQNKLIEGVSANTEFGENIEIDEEGIIRGNINRKELSLVFTGHEYADGAEVILNTLNKNKVEGSFFLTGDFYRKFPDISRRLQELGHYLAPHSDKHLLYADWTNRDSTLVSKSQFEEDLKDNYRAMESVGLRIDSPLYFMPSYEWYNSEISRWAYGLGVKVVNFTPGTTSNADYTTPEMSNYRSSEVIYNNILEFEENDVDGLNGFILLIHIGTDPKRTDKLYDRLDDLITELKKRDYEFVRVDELLSL